MLRVINSTTNDGMWEYKESITKIIIQKEIKPIENAILEYDESTKKDKSIMSYIVENELHLLPTQLIYNVIKNYF